MKRVLFFMLLGASAVVVGQQLWLQQDAQPSAPDSQQGADADAVEGEVPPSDEAAEVEAPSDEAEPEAAAEQAPGEQVGAGEADMEFEPDEEISEDYPVPLPSDI